LQATSNSKEEGAKDNVKKHTFFERQKWAGHMDGINLYLQLPPRIRSLVRNALLYKGARGVSIEDTWPTHLIAVRSIDQKEQF